MLDKLNFSYSDKRNFPNSDVHTENCLILLLPRVSAAAGRLVFFPEPLTELQTIKTLLYRLFVSTKTMGIRAFALNAVGACFPGPLCLLT